jgi:ariadne-1
MLHLQCGHKFCSSCWIEYLKDKIIERGLCDIRCMQTECKWLVPGSFIQKLCGDEVYNRFEVLSLRRHVEGIPYLKFCPAPDCPDIVSCPAAANKSALKIIVPTVTCSNGHTFCFGCHIDSDHRPVLCRIAKLWLDKCRVEVEIQPQLTRQQEHIASINWINANTKECPECHIRIQKNGGCK